MNGDNAQDVGIKIAKRDVDVNQAGDTDLLLNSSWPTLQIAFETTVSGQGVTQHGLPFVPFTVIWTRSGSTVSKSIPNVNSALVFHSTGTVHVKCYNLDITKDVEYPFISPPSSVTTETDPDFGLKMVKEGKSLDSKDLRDYITHTRCQSPMVLAVKTEQSGVSHPTQGKQINYTSPYEFPSWVFGFVWIESLQRYQYAPYFAQSYPITRITNNSYNLQYLNGKASLVVLRDPFFAPTERQASY